MENSKKIILDLCGGTGAWSRPYDEAGYIVYNITLPKYDITKTKTTNDEIIFRKDNNNNYRLKIKKKDIYGILAAPPCTEFSRAKTTKPRDFEKGMKMVEACMKIIWEVQKVNKLQFWALENPVGLLRRFLGNPPYSFRQWWFGHDRSKHTDIWGRFKEPKRLAFQEPIYLQRSSHNRNTDWYSSSSAEKRAITPSGFARAFFKANK